MTPSIGRIVHYVLNHGKSEGQHRPAIIIETCEHLFGAGVYSREECQLMVFVDGSNDGTPWHGLPIWATSVPHDEDGTPGTWHWPERVA